MVVRTAAASRPSSIAVIDGDVTFSYRELSEAMGACAAAWLRLGLRSADAVAILAPNCLEWIIAALGIQAAGATLVPVNTRLKGGEVQYILNRTRARYVVTTRSFLGVDYTEMLKSIDLPRVERTIVLPSADGRTEWDEFLDHAPADVTRAFDALERLSPDVPSDIIFTSGTTGVPKGAVTTHAQNVWNYRNLTATLGLTSDDRSMVIFPFSHSAGYKAGWLAAFLQGGVVCPEPILDIPRIVERLIKNKISFICAPPAVFHTILAVPPEQRGNYAALRSVMIGGATIPPTLIDRMRTELKIKNVVAGYGLTESGGTATMTREGDSLDTIANTVGRPLPGIELRCVDASGQTLPAGEPGEIVIRGPNVMREYFEDPDATKETIDKDGWLYTGDIGTLDLDGNLRVTDRKKDMFIVGGFNCYPAEIERMMSTHPAIAQTAVIGVPDERMGEAGKAFIVLRPGASASADEIIAWCRQVMANYKVPRYVAFVNELPINASGKVQKALLRQSP
jgi:acyl-CoA synthetase (AMP-forming)/AMP-acid ligase II